MRKGAKGNMSPRMPKSITSLRRISRTVKTVAMAGRGNLETLMVKLLEEGEWKDVEREEMVTEEKKRKRGKTR